MPLTDATNAVAVAPPAGADAAVLKAKPTGSAAPNPEKLGIALDAVAGFDAAARDDATAKLEAAASKDAAGLCIALLGVASDAGCAPARRLAAATFTRNCLRKQWGARDAARDDTTTNESARVTSEARADVRGASLRALVAAPPDTRRLLADCLRLAATDAVGWSASGPTGADGASSVASGTGHRLTDRLASAAALVDDVVAVSERHETFSHDAFDASNTQGGLLLAAHVACVPFQYFRDATVAREAAHPAAEKMSKSLVAPKLVPALKDVSQRAARDANAAQFARVAFKILFRLVRAHMPAAISGGLAGGGPSHRGRLRRARRARQGDFADFRRRRRGALLGRREARASAGRRARHQTRGRLRRGFDRETRALGFRDRLFATGTRADTVRRGGVRDAPRRARRRGDARSALFLCRNLFRNARNARTRLGQGSSRRFSRARAFMRRAARLLDGRGRERRWFRTRRSTREPTRAAKPPRTKPWRTRSTETPPA
jgi:hypothetical protein